MKVSLNKVFPLDGPVDAAWQQLQDIETVAGCMPGAEITAKTDDTHYSGKVKVKLGPVNVAFSGTIEVQSVDADECRLHLLAAGKDAKGTSSASMDLTAHISASDSAGSELVGDAEVTVNGKLANFGGRMMTQVADQILQQFADNFAARLSSAESQGAGAGDAESSSSDDDAAVAPSAGAAGPEPAATNEINGFKFAWSVIVGFFKSFFGRTA